MNIASSENSFRRGLAALRRGDPEAASNHFREAIVMDGQRRLKRPQMPYLSYYGLSLALARGATQHAIQACEVASHRDAFNPDLLLNLGRVYLMAGKTTRALATIELGLRIAPNHRRLLAELAKANRREAPPLSFVPRNHPLNTWLGKLRFALRTRAPKLTGTSRLPHHS